MRKILIGVVGGLVVAAAWWLLRDQPNNAAGDPLRPPASSSETELSEPVETSAKPIVALPFEATKAPPPKKTRAKKAPPQKPKRRMGLLRVTDENGIVQEGLSGFMIMRPNAPITGLVVDVKNGQFKWPYDDSRLEITSIRAGNRDAWPTNIAIDDSYPIIDAIFVHSWTVEFIDGASGESLKDVTLRSHPVWVSGSRPEGETLAKRHGNPVVINPRLPLRSETHESRLWAHTKGYAWTPFVIDHRRAGTMKVDLSRSGILRLTVEGGKGYKLIATLHEVKGSGGQPPRMRAGIHSAAFSGFRDIPVGRWRLSIGDGADSGAPALYSEIINVHADAVTNIVAKLPNRAPKAPRDQTPALVSGTLKLPGSWLDADQFTLRIRGRSAGKYDYEPEIILPLTQLKSEGPRSYQFQCEQLRAGQLRLEIEAIGWEQEFLLPPTGLDSVVAIVPAPLSTFIQLVDEQTGEVLTNGEVFFTPPTNPSSKRGPRTRIAPATSDGARILHLQSSVEVMASAPGYQSRRLSTPLSAQGGLQTIALQRSSGVDYEVQVDEKVLPYDVAWKVALTPVAAGRVTRISSGSFSVEGAGHYRLSMTAPKGFEAVTPRVIEIGQGERVSVVILLLRAQK